MTDLVLGDDHPVFVESLGTVLARRGFTVRAVATTAEEIVTAVACCRPAVVVVDRHLGADDGIRLLPTILRASPSSRALVLTAYADAPTTRLALDAGACGLLSKTAGMTALVEAITRVAVGDVLPGDGAGSWADADGSEVGSGRDEDVVRLASYLTQRERECLALMVDGCGSEAMAERMGVSVTTVRGYVQGVLTKLGAHSRVEATSMAVRFSLGDRAAG